MNLSENKVYRRGWMEERKGENDIINYKTLKESDLLHILRESQITFVIFFVLTVTTELFALVDAPTPAHSSQISILQN
jgi:fumarate reductase subunit C